jgi:hypothetical protein
MSDVTIPNVSSNGIVSGVDFDKSAFHKAAIVDIVGMIRAKYEDEGTRNFAIGKRAYEHAQWQRGNFAGYQPSDFDSLMKDIRNDVRVYVPIKSESIRVADWVYAHVLREEVSLAAGPDVAQSLTMFEYIRLIGKALSFNKKDVEGSLVEGWLDLIKGVAYDRSLPNGRVNAEDFTGRIDANVKRLADLAIAKDPVAHAAKVAGDAAKAKIKAVNDANTAVASSVSDALAGQHLTTEGVMSIVENVAKHHGVPLPASYGFDPATCSIADCKVVAETMFRAGKFEEMKALMDALGKGLAIVDAKRATADAKAARAASRVNPSKEKAVA